MNKSFQATFLLFACVSLAFAQQQNVTTPDFGTLIGSTTTSAWTNKTIYQYLGVRYAYSPSGELRFKVSHCLHNGQLHNTITNKPIFFIIQGSTISNTMERNP